MPDPRVLPTVWQRVCLWVWHWPNVDESYLAKLYAAGARVIAVQLQDDGPLPRAKAAAWKALGFKLHGVVHPYAEDGKLWTPQATVDFAVQERSRLSLNGLRFNFEDEVEAADQGAGQWSADFCSIYRRRVPWVPSALDTYKGAAGMNLTAYRVAGFRLLVQTYDATGLWTDPVESVVAWTTARGWPKGHVRPTFGVFKFDGVRLEPSVAIASAKAAGTLGASLYYVDGAFDELETYLVPFVKNLIAVGAGSGSG